MGPLQASHVPSRTWLHSSCTHTPATAAKERLNPNANKCITHTRFLSDAHHGSLRVASLALRSSLV